MTAVLLSQTSGQVLQTISFCLAICYPLYALEVENMIESDHLPVVLTINVSQNAAVAVDQSNAIQKNRQNGLTEKIIWQEDKEQIFQQQKTAEQ